MDFIAEKSLEKLDEKCEDVIENPRFGDIAPDVMEAILNRTTLVVTEVNLFKALITWKTKYLERTDTNESIEEKMHKVGSFLQKIRYPLMNIDELCQVVFPQNLFKPDDVGRMIAQHKLGLSNLNSIARKGCFGDEYSFSFVLDEAYPRFVFQTDADVFVTRIEVQPYSELCKSLVIYTQPNKSSGYRTYETLVSKSSCNCFFVKRPFLVRKNTLQKVICGESFMEKEHPENKPLFEKRTARAFTVYISEYSRNVEIRVRYPNITTCFEESLCLTMFFRPAPQC